MAQMEHKLFMVAVEGNDLVVTATCSYAHHNKQDLNGFLKCTYQVALPKGAAEKMTTDQMFEEARKIFLSVTDDF